VVEGERIPVSATVFKEGHDLLAARALLLPAGPAAPAALAGAASGDREALEVTPLLLDANDIWRGTLQVPEGLGWRLLVVEAWTDHYETWAHKVRVKLAAGAPVDVEMAEAAAFIRSRGVSHPALAAALDALERPEASVEARLAAALGPDVGRLLAGPGSDRTPSEPVRVWVDRRRAAEGAWYELFPRSFGGFQGVSQRVSQLAAQGFDILYFPPIHPIGRTERKGRNNTLGANPGDPGSPWAIGAAEGGHCAIHPDLGTFEDFDMLLHHLEDVGMELALDYALQCSPDHPWVHEHPEWFHHRPDGTIAYAENPPKRYQDIYPINFWPEAEADRVALWDACKAILEFWIARGVHIFRVDNPHTKPVAFWEWLIPEIQSTHPEVIFLAEAFTRPAVMAKLAEVGFSQSYTYFTWRTEQHGPEGLWAYMQELAHGPKVDFMRPNFWPNTPDILAGPLRNGTPGAFALRFVLAATLSPSYGIYSGYELYENSPASPDNEEYLNSEKYETRTRDFDRADSLSPLIAAINGIRRRHRAFANLRGVHFHPSDNPDIVAYSRTSDDGTDNLLVVVNLNPSSVSESTVHLDPRAFQATTLGLQARLEAFDELSGQRHYLTQDFYVRLTPPGQVAHVFDLRTAGV